MNEIQKAIERSFDECIETIKISFGGDDNQNSKFTREFLEHRKKNLMRFHEKTTVSPP